MNRATQIAIVLLLAVIAIGVWQGGDQTTVIESPWVAPAECAGLTDYYVAKCDPLAH